MTSAENGPAPRQDAVPTPAAAQTTRPQQQALALTPVAGTPPRSLPERARTTRQLWLCLQLPGLPLAAVDVAAGDLPVAVFEERHGVREVLEASAAAAAAGIRPGLTVNAALALVPDLLLAERDPDAELRTLEALAGWAECFTSFVSLDAPDRLLLEIAASLRLFGGLDALRERIVTELSALGFQSRQGLAPTPLAATWLARAGASRPVTDRDRRAGTRGRLPVAVLAWPSRQSDALAGMGLDCIGDLLRLPRDGFAKRFGAGRLLELDRAVGRLPDPRPHYRAPATFRADLDLDGEEDDRERLLVACGQLLDRLEGFLLERQLAVQRLVFSFYHLDHPATGLATGALEAGHSARHWRELLAIRFETVELPAPVIAIRLAATDGRPLDAQTASFGFAGGERRAAIAALVERLAARIGDDAVQGLYTVAEHRPDYAFAATRVAAGRPQAQATPRSSGDEPPAAGLARERPLWLLDAPLPLACHDGRPQYRGPLALAGGPERIETGWWDAHGIARDYYVARTRDGAWLWVFRERGGQGGGWYLHGRFG